MSLWWLGALQTLEGKDFAVDVRDACGAPCGLRDWLSGILEFTRLSKTRWPLRFDPFHSHVRRFKQQA